MTLRGQLRQQTCSLGLLLSSLIFFFVVFPFCLGADISQIKPFARDVEAKSYLTVSLLSPVKAILQDMSNTELQEIPWEKFDPVIERGELLDGRSPLTTAEIQLRENITIANVEAINRAAVDLILSHPLSFLKNRCLMFWSIAGGNSWTYFLHDGLNLNPRDLAHWGLAEVSVYRILTASLVLPFLGFIFCLLFWRSIPCTVLTLGFAFSRVPLAFVFAPAPHFTYLYSVYLCGFFIPLIWFIEHSARPFPIINSN